MHHHAGVPEAVFCVPQLSTQNILQDQYILEQSVLARFLM